MAEDAAGAVRRTPRPEPCSNCKGHKRYVGGIMDGEVAHLTKAAPSDYPQTFGTLLRNGTRSWYEIDYNASEGTEAVYRFIGHGKTFPSEGSLT